jgi:pimeloyl-ACP methyl ester carboxylesterase
MAYFHHDGIDFHFRDEGQGVPFVFMHGLGGNVEQPSTLYEPIPGVRFITLDFRGHGETRRFGRPENFRFSVFAQDLLALMNDLNIDQAVVGGISMGAGVALHFALHYPDKVNGLILSRVAWEDKPMPENNRRVYEEIARHIRQYGPRTGKTMFLNTDVYKNMEGPFPDTAQSLLRQFEYEYAAETWPKYLYIPRDAPNFDRSEWEKITVPTLVLANRKDPIHPFEFGQFLAKRIPNALLKEVTSKSVDPIRHMQECKRYIGEFLTAFLPNGGQGR